MENVSIAQSTNLQNTSGIAAPKTETQRAESQLQRIVDTQETQQKNFNLNDQEQARFEAVKKAARHIISTNPLSPSSARFTIYRDTLSDGIVFVTRFTNISDGKVTLIREPDLLSQIREQGTLLDGMV